MTDTKRSKSHPGQGVAVFCHSSSNGRPMFGSQLDTHYTCVRLYISTAVVFGENDGTAERYMDKKQLIAVEFTANQFAQLLSTHNVMPGTPCTITRYNGKAIEPPPIRKTNMQSIRDNFKEKLQTLVTEMGETEDEMVVALATGKPLSKTKQKDLLLKFRIFGNKLRTNLPFALEMFQEAATDTASHAQQEVASAMKLMLQQAGMRAFNNKQLLPPAEVEYIPLLLEADNSTEKSSSSS